MNLRARVVELTESVERTEAVPAVPVPKPREKAEAHWYGSLVDLLCGIRSEQDRGVIAAFTAVSPGATVTDVTQSVAFELARETDARILLSSAVGFSHAARVRVSDVGADSPHQVYRIEDPGNLGPSRMDLSGVEELRLRFGFVLVACPSLHAIPLHSVMKGADYLVLAALAGQTTYPEVIWAQNSVSAYSDKVLGWVLNHGTGGEL